MALLLFFAPGALRLVFAFPAEFDWWNCILALPIFNLGLFSIGCGLVKSRMLMKLTIAMRTFVMAAVAALVMLHVAPPLALGVGVIDIASAAADGLGDFDRDAEPHRVRRSGGFPPHNSRDASRAPSPSASSFAHMMDGCTRRTSSDCAFMSGGGNGLKPFGRIAGRLQVLVASLAHPGLRHRDIPWPVQRTEYQLICARRIWITRSFWRLYYDLNCSGPNCPNEVLLVRSGWVAQHVTCGVGGNQLTTQFVEWPAIVVSDRYDVALSPAHARYFFV